MYGTNTPATPSSGRRLSTDNVDERTRLFSRRLSVEYVQEPPAAEPTTSRLDQSFVIRRYRSFTDFLRWISKGWQTLMVLTIAISAGWLPYELAFFDRHVDQLAFSIVNYVLDIIFICDFVRNIVFGGKSFESSTDEIAVSKPPGYPYRILFSLIWAIPWPSLLYTFRRPDDPVLLFILLRLVRLTDILDAFSQLEKNVKYSYFTTRALRFLALVLFQGHWCGCFFWFLARIKGFAEDTWVGKYDPEILYADHFAQYVRSVYWSFVVFASIGFGDVAAVNEYEECFLIFMVITNLGLSSYILGNMAALAVSVDAGTAKFRHHLRRLETYMKAKYFPSKLQTRLIQYHRLMFESNDLYSKMLEGDLPYAFRLEVADHLNRKLLNEVPLFMCCENDFMSRLAVLLRRFEFTEGQTIMYGDDTAEELYIVASGCVVLSFKEPQGQEGVPIQRSLCKGEAFGYFSFLFGIPVHIRVVAITRATIAVVAKDEFEELVRVFPSSGSVIRRNALAQGRLHLQKSYARIEAQIRKAQVGSVSDLLYAACIGDVEGVEDALLEGIDICSTDYDRRSALHVAASEGHVRMVEFLLSRGADPNAKDRWGSTPLDNARHFGHTNIIALLEKSSSSSQVRRPMPITEKPEYEDTSPGTSTHNKGSPMPRSTTTGSVSDLARGLQSPGKRFSNPSTGTTTPIEGTGIKGLTGKQQRALATLLAARRKFSSTAKAAAILIPQARADALAMGYTRLTP